MADEDINEYIGAGLSLAEMRPQILPKNLLTGKGTIYVNNTGTSGTVSVLSPTDDNQIIVKNSDGTIGFSSILSVSMISGQISTNALISSNTLGQIMIIKNQNNAMVIDWSDDGLVFDIPAGQTVSGRQFTNIMGNYTSNLFTFTGITENTGYGNKSYFTPAIYKDTEDGNVTIAENIGQRMITTELSNNDHCLTIRALYSEIPSEEV